MRAEVARIQIRCSSSAHGRGAGSGRWRLSPTNPPARQAHPPNYPRHPPALSAAGQHPAASNWSTQPPAKQAPTQPPTCAICRGSTPSGVELVYICSRPATEKGEREGGSDRATRRVPSRAGAAAAQPPSVLQLGAAAATHHTRLPAAGPSHITPTHHRSSSAPALSGR